MIEGKKSQLLTKLPLIFTGIWIALLALLYANAHRKNEQEKAPLTVLKTEYLKILDKKKARYQVLKEQVNSLSDPAAGEKALIEELGVIPKGMQRVVCNTKSDECTALP